MSQENIDVVLASIEAYNAEDLDAQMATYAPDAVIVFDPAQALAFGGDTLAGREAFRNEVKAAQQFFGARYKPAEVRAVGESEVLCRGEIGGIGAASGIEGYDRMSTLFTVRDGLITRLEFYRDHDEALKAAGLDKRPISANADLVRSIYADWERGDYKSVTWADAELEVVSPDGPEPGRWKGLAAVAERWRAYLRAWGNLRAEAEEYREVDGERVLVLARNRGVGKTSGLDVAQIGESANVFHIRAGKVRKLVLYWNRERAFADLGIEE